MSDELHELLADARRHLDHELATSAAAPDLAASVARAHQLDPSAVPAQVVQDVAGMAPLAQLRPSAGRGARVREDMSDRAALAPFTASLRDQLEADLARQIHRGALLAASGSGPAVPPIPLARRRPWTALALALAAAVLLALGLSGVLTARRARPDADPGAAALSERDPHGAQVTHGAKTSPKPGPPGPSEPVPRDSSMTSSAPGPEDSSATEPAADRRTPPREPVPGDSSAVAPERHVGARMRPRRPAPEPPTPAAAEPAEDPLVALDREAQQRWRAGDLRGAADKFAEIVQRAPGSRAAEAAHGDLFALEHQLGGDPVGPWRAYLRQFPRGRYADDARAAFWSRSRRARSGPTAPTCRSPRPSPPPPRPSPSPPSRPRRWSWHLPQRTAHPSRPRPAGSSASPATPGSASPPERRSSGAPSTAAAERSASTPAALAAPSSASSCARSDAARTATA